MKMFSKSATETWQMVARAQFFFSKTENRNSKGSSITIVPTQIYEPSAVPEKNGTLYQKQSLFLQK